MSGSDNKSNYQTFLRSSVIGTLNSWINDLSSTSIFQNFNNLLNFKRRQSRSPSSLDENDHTTINSFQDETLTKIPAKLLNGTLIPTLKAKEVIELANFGVVELESSEQGIGHSFHVSYILEPIKPYFLNKNKRSK